MLVILTLVAVGLLSLAGVTIRSSSANAEQLEADANARMALMIAIGQLQQTMGPDRRISARAMSMVRDPRIGGILSPGQPIEVSTPETMPAYRSSQSVAWTIDMTPVSTKGPKFEL